MLSDYYGRTSLLPPVFQEYSSLVLAVFCIASPFLVTSLVTSFFSFYRISCKPTSSGIAAPIVPYSIPYVGNTLQFAITPLKFITHLTTKYRNIPVRLTLGARKIYIVSGAQNIHSIFSRSKDVSTKGLTMMVLQTAFGMNPSDAKVFEDDNSGLYIKPDPDSDVSPERRVFYLVHHGYTSWLTGAGLAELSKQFVRNLQLRIDQKNSELGDSWGELPDIFEYIQTETFISTTTALMGEHFLRLNPTFVEDFWAFDYNLINLLKRKPRWLVPKAYTAREKAHESIVRWHAWANEQLDPRSEHLKDVLWEPIWGAAVIRGRAAICAAIPDLSAGGVAASDLGMIWAANANVIPAAGWSLLHVLADENLTSRIRAEIEHCFSSKSPGSVDFLKLCACPLLNSVVSEVLRLRIAMFINRTSVIPDMKFGKWIVEKGQVILASIYFSHRDATLWNQGLTLPSGQKEHPLDSFWAERFLVYPNDPMSGPTKKDFEDTMVIDESIVRDDKEARYSVEGLKAVYIPFGGGTNMCPGRHYAKNEMLLVVAMMLWAFDFDVLDVDGLRETKANMRRFPNGTLGPDRKNAFRIRCRRWE